ncbi:hypothetical protein ACHBTE_15465 [Streptomyces sp. M41]|uniref:hypothetical protein n=1 Tax=Streptomyces sp. M41 TaxID=3059412 RepID=UPI00374DB1E5
MIGRRFNKTMTLSAIAQTLHRHGFSHQVPPPLDRARRGSRHWLGEGDMAPRCRRHGGARGLALLTKSASRCSLDGNSTQVAGRTHIRLARPAFPFSVSGGRSSHGVPQAGWRGALLENQASMAGRPAGTPWLVPFAGFGSRRKSALWAGTTPVMLTLRCSGPADRVGLVCCDDPGR